MTATTRMLELLSLLQLHRDWPGPVLADRLAISERTVRRDVDRLRELGYRIRALKGPDGGYRLDAGSDLPPLLFDDDQAVVLAIALQSVALDGELGEAAGRALTTVRQVMPSRLRHRIDVLRSAIAAAPRDDGAAIGAEVLSTLAAAVHESRVLRIDYTRVGADQVAEPSRRRIEPHHLVSRQGRWYLIAWDLDRSDWRVYRADRVVPRTPVGGVFRRRPLPGGDAIEYLEARMKGSDRGNVWPCRGSAVLAVPAAELAPYLTEDAIEPIDEASCRITAGAWSWRALAATFGRFDADLSDVRPPELAAAFGELGARFAAATTASRLA